MVRRLALVARVAGRDGVKRFRLALVVGKFAPLHRGHEALVAQAQAAANAVLVLSYSQPELPGCGVARRRRWLRQRVPQARVEVLDQRRLDALCAARGLAPRPLVANAAGDAEHHAFLAWLLAEVLDARPDALFANEAYAAPCAAALSTAWRRPVQAASPDRERRAVPIAATAIRADVHGQRHWLAPEVYASFVETVAILGGESSGKTTLAAALAEHWQTLWVPEYGRTLWERRGGRLTLDDLSAIAATQVAHERAQRLAACRYLFCDTTPLATLGYAEWLFGRQPPVLARLARRRYTHTLLCAPDFAFVQDGTRQDAGFRSRQHAWYRHRLDSSHARYVELTGSLKRRLAQACAVLHDGAVSE